MAAVDGFGKTSFGASAPKPIFLMSDGETGLETLIDNDQLDETPHLPPITTWEAKDAAIDFLLNEDHGCKTLVLDTHNGFEALCHDYICRTQYGGKWGSDGFLSYMQGYSHSLPEWSKFLGELDTVREKRNMGVIGLCHVKISPFKNPSGPDYDRYTAAMHDKTWELTKRWYDMILFGNFHTVVDGGNDKKGKGKGGRDRVLYTVRTAAYDAKHRHGLPEEIEMGNSGKEAWANFVAALKQGRAK